MNFKNKLFSIYNQKNLNQISKLILTITFCVILLLGIELIFSIPGVSSLFNEGILKGKQGVLFWIALWVAMFLQVTIIPIPALPIYVICNNIPGLIGGEGILGLFSGRTLFFCIFVTSACWVGCILAYFLGRLGGKKLVKWIAGSEDDFNLWCCRLNGKKGKLIYAATVLFPIFPDDLLSIVVGSLKMDFKFYIFINFIFKFIGVFAMLLFIRLPIAEDIFSIGDPNSSLMSIIVYGIVILICIILYIICKIAIKKLHEKDPV